MKKFLTISIDVEPDCSPDWTYSAPLTFRGMNEGIGEILHPLFGKFGMKPTYLLNNVVLDDQNSVDFLRSLTGEFELGTHLHPEFIEPERLYHDYAGKTARRNCCFYPPEIETAKIANITNLFREKFGYAPTSFRAGRFSAGANTMSSLLDLGYKVDSSVTPHIRWSDSTREGPVDFSYAAEQPYFIQKGSITAHSAFKEGLLQVPVTIGLLKKNRVMELAVSGLGLRRRINWNRRVWLRPAFSRFEDMKELIEQYTSKYADRDAIVFNMMFHNVETIRGLSPYTLTDEACNQYRQDLESFFAYCNDEGISGIGLTDTYQIFKGSPIINMNNVQRSKIINM